MKYTYKTIIVFAFLVITTTACKKQLETVPEGTITELTNFKAIQNALSGCYAGFKSSSYYNNPRASGSGSGWSALPDLMGDDMIEATQSLGNWRTLSEMRYSTDNGIVQELFSQPYEIISRANNILQALGPFESDLVTQDEAKTIKAQLLAIRAHAHFDLMRYFAPDFARNSNALGVPYVTIFDAQKPLNYLPARNTVKENYDKVYADLNEALILFRAGGNTKLNSTRNLIDSTVVYAMRARVKTVAR